MNLAFITILSVWVAAALVAIYLVDPILAYALGVSAGITLVVVGLILISHAAYHRIKRITWRSK